MPLIDHIRYFTGPGSAAILSAAGPVMVFIHDDILILRSVTKASYSSENTFIVVGINDMIKQNK